MTWWLPRAASSFAGSIDGLFIAVLIITGLAFFIVEGGLLWFILKYRRREGRRAHYTHGSTKAEVIWTSVPAVTVVALGVISSGHWTAMRGRDSVPENAYPIGMLAKQFEWRVTYPGLDGELGTSDDLRLRNQLHLVVDQPVVLYMEAEDVIHSFFVPEFRVKQDIVPGMVNRLWFVPTQIGEFEIACAELCGMGHYRMRGRVVVHTAEEFNAWLARQAAGGEVAS
jgi:cytochrome c oxidase subunit 2